MNTNAVRAFPCDHTQHRVRPRSKECMVHKQVYPGRETSTSASPNGEGINSPIYPPPALGQVHPLLSPVPLFIRTPVFHLPFCCDLQPRHSETPHIPSLTIPIHARNDRMVYQFSALSMITVIDGEAGTGLGYRFNASCWHEIVALPVEAH